MVKLKAAVFVHLNANYTKDDLVRELYAVKNDRRRLTGPGGGKKQPASPSVMLSDIFKSCVQMRHKSVRLEAPPRF